MEKNRKKSKGMPSPNSILSVKHEGALITYDKEADAAYFKVKKGRIAKTIKLDEWLLADVDKKGGLLGIEMLFVSLRFPKRSIISSLKRNNSLLPI